MTPRRLTAVALVGEGALALAGVAWAGLRELPLRSGPVGRGLAAGVAASLALAALNFFLLRYAPPVAGVRSIRRLYGEVLRPLFSRVQPRDIAAISLAAGIGEEIFFRGAVQPEIGLVPASVLFGLMHVGGSRALAFGAWAAALGLMLGGLAVLTGGLLAPAVAHAGYDAIALAYLRWGDPPPESPETTTSADRPL